MGAQHAHVRAHRGGLSHKPHAGEGGTRKEREKSDRVTIRGEWDVGVIVGWNVTKHGGCIALAVFCYRETQGETTIQKPQGLRSGAEENARGEQLSSEMGWGRAPLCTGGRGYTRVLVAGCTPAMRRVLPRAAAAPAGGAVIHTCMPFTITGEATTPPTMGAG